MCAVVKREARGAARGYFRVSPTDAGLHPYYLNCGAGTIMGKHKISCGRINPICENMAEVIFNENVELNAKHAEEVHNFLNFNFKAPVSILNNMVNHHSYDFDAQTVLWAIPEIKRVGFVACNMVAEMSVKVFLLAPREKVLDARIFKSRAEAIQWLDNELPLPAGLPLLNQQD